MTRAKDISKIVTDANLSGTLDVTGAFTSQGIDDNADATAITINASQNVGIGVSPSTKLHIKGANPEYRIEDNNETGSGNIVFRDSARETAKISVASGASSTYQINMLGTPAFRIDSNNDISFYEDTGTTASLVWDSSQTQLKVTGRETSRGGGVYAFDLDNSAHTSNLTSAGAMRVKGAYGDSLIVNGLGDVSFFDDSGNAKLFWDASAESLGIGTSSPTANLDIKRTGGDSDDIIRIGTTDNFYLGISRSNTTGAFSFQGNQTGFNNIILAPTSGSVSIGTTDTQPQNGGSAFKVESLSRRSLFMSQSGTGNANIIVFYSVGNLSGAINIASGSVSYGSGSDYRIKENIVDLTDATTRLKQLKPKRFNFITNPDDEARDGFLAHEVSSIVPEAVIGEKDAVDENGEIIVQQLDPSKLVPLLVKTIQELEARIVALETA